MATGNYVNWCIKQNIRPLELPDKIQHLIDRSNIEHNCSSRIEEAALNAFLMEAEQ